MVNTTEEKKNITAHVQNLYNEGFIVSEYNKNK